MAGRARRSTASAVLGEASLDGLAMPRRDAEDRLLELKAVVDQLKSVLRDEPARLWPRSPNPDLAWRKPLELIAEGEYRPVIAVVLAMAEGVTAWRRGDRRPASGRRVTLSSHRSRLATTCPRYDRRSGEGARPYGGCFNPPRSFPVLYICQSRPCAVAELKRFGRSQAIGVDGLLPRMLYRYEVVLDGVLDRRNGEVRTQVGLGQDVLPGPDWTSCQELGSTARALGVKGINSPSAACTDGLVLP